MVLEQDETANNKNKLARSQQQPITKLPSFTTTRHEKTFSTTVAIDDDGIGDDEATLIGSISGSHIKSHRSTSTKRRKKHSSNDSNAPAINNSFLDKHKNRTRKESLFIKQMKSVCCITEKRGTVLHIIN
jgi:hypothetical protein